MKRHHPWRVAALALTACAWPAFALGEEAARPAAAAQPDADGTYTIQLGDPDADAPAGEPSGDLHGGPAKAKKHGKPEPAHGEAPTAGHGKPHGPSKTTAHEAPKGEAAGHGAKAAPSPAHGEDPGADHGASPGPDHGEGPGAGPTHELLPAPDKSEPKSKPKTKARPRDWKPLTGTGFAPARQNKWGVVEAVPPALAARARMAFRGDEVEFPEKIHFKYNSLRFEQGADEVLARIADSLQSSPEIQKLWIEGHTNVSGGEAYNQKLSEARASAVREALVRRGVAPERLVAYGFGETRLMVAGRNGRTKPENRRVVFRLVQADRPALQTRRVMEYGQAAVIGVWGPVRWRVAAAEAPVAAEPEAGDWQALTFRTQLPEGAVIETGESGRALVRLPDLTRIVIEADTRLALTKLFHSQREGKSYTSARIETGALRVSANPDERGVSTGIWSFPGGAAELTTADFEVRARAEGTSISVLRGALKASTGGANSIDVRAGQRLAAGASEPVNLLDGPEVESPRNGTVPEAALSWKPLTGAVRYRVEVAEDISFYQVVHQEDTTSHGVALARLEAGRPWYWRVRAMGDDGALGRSSRLYGFRVDPTAAPPVGAPTVGPQAAPAGAAPAASAAEVD